MNPQDKSRSYTLFEVVFFEVHNGKIVSSAKRGLTYIALDKIEIYAMGQVAKYPEDELRYLQWLKQHKRKDFDEYQANEEKLKRLKYLRHNYERSQEMYESISQVGLVNSVEDVEKIIDHLLDIGEEITTETSNKQTSTLEAPKGRLRIMSIWKILSDGRKYLSTLQFIPKGFE